MGSARHQLTHGSITNPDRPINLGAVAFLNLASVISATWPMKFRTAARNSSGDRIVIQANCTIGRNIWYWRSHLDPEAPSGKILRQ